MITVRKTENWGRIVEGMFDVFQDGNPWLRVGESLKTGRLYIIQKYINPSWVSDADLNYIKSVIQNRR